MVPIIGLGTNALVPLELIEIPFFLHWLTRFNVSGPSKRMEQDRRALISFNGQCMPGGWFTKGKRPSKHYG